MAVFHSKYKSLTDEKLMELVTERDARAFEEIYDRYSERMVNYFFRMLWKNEELAQDFMQDLFTKIVHKPQLYNSSRPFKTWVFSVANNMCKNEYRKYEVRRNTAYEMPAEAPGENGQEPIRKMDTSDFNKQLNEALKELDETKRATFIMRYKQDLSIKEISDVMECSEGTVKSRLFYTLKQLNTRLKAFENIGLIAMFFNILNGIS